MTSSNAAIPLLHWGRTPSYVRYTTSSQQGMLDHVRLATVNTKDPLEPTHSGGGSRLVAPDALAPATMILLVRHVTGRHPSPTRPRPWTLPAHTPRRGTATSRSNCRHQHVGGKLKPGVEEAVSPFLTAHGDPHTGTAHGSRAWRSPRSRRTRSLRTPPRTQSSAASTAQGPAQPR